MKKFFLTLKESFIDLFRKPLLIFFSAILWAIFFGMSFLGKRIAGNLQTTLANVIWTISFGLVTIALASYFFAGAIRLTKKHNFSNFFGENLKSFASNFLIFVTIFAVSIGIGRVAHYAGLFLGHAFSLGVDSAVIVYVLLYFAGLVGILIYFTYASVFLVVENLSFKKAILRSVEFVKKEYLATLSMLVIFFVIFSLLNYISGWIGDLVAYCLLVPYFVCVVVRMARRE